MNFRLLAAIRTPYGLLAADRRERPEHQVSVSVHAGGRAKCVNKNTCSSLAILLYIAWYR